MVLGLLFILAGVLIAIYPELLSIIVAAFLIFAGISILSMHFYFKRFNRDTENPFTKFIIRF